MASIVGDYALDAGLMALHYAANSIHLVSADPVNYAGLAAVTLANKSFEPGTVVGVPIAATPNGRKVLTVAITDGEVTDTGTATGWAIVDSINSRLLANGQLVAPIEVTKGNAFTLSSYAIRMPNQ